VKGFLEGRNMARTGRGRDGDETRRDRTGEDGAGHGVTKMRGNPLRDEEEDILGLFVLIL
jgi:hypothetical protein